MICQVHETVHQVRLAQVVGESYIAANSVVRLKWQMLRSAS